MLKIEDNPWEYEGEIIPDKRNVLNLGCGTDTKDKGIIHADKLRLEGVNIILDLELPLPFKSNSIDEIWLERVMGHIKHPIKLRKEINRILKYGGVLQCKGCGCSGINQTFNSDHRYIKVATTDEEINEFIELFEMSNNDKRNQNYPVHL